MKHVITMMEDQKIAADVSKIDIDEKVVEQLEKLTKELFKLLGVAVDLEVTHDTENDAVLVNLSAEESAGLIIGRRGETIASIQSVLGMMARQKLGGWVRVIVNIGDYREKQEDQLKDLALTAADRARETHTPQTLYNLTSAQRRIIHLVLSEEKDIVTESEGEGRERHLVVSVKE